nr:amphi-Trp domain-containing protein [Micromonospora sp. DSM 115978]
MGGMDIFEDARTVSRTDLAAWLRQLANQLETTGQIFYGAAGTVTVADQVECELEIEAEDDEFSIEIEFSWAKPKAVEAAEPTNQSGPAEKPQDTGTDAEAEAETDKDTLEAAA